MANIKDLKFDDKNFNKHTEFGMGLLEKSLRENGAGRSILIDKDNNIIAGNGIVEAAGQIGMDKVKIVEISGDELVAVKRTDIELDSKKGREMALADNATAAADLSWDFDNMLEEFKPEELEDWGVSNIKTGIKDEKDIENKPPTIVTSFITLDYSDEIQLSINDDTASNLMNDMINYRNEHGNYNGFWDERLKK